MLAIPLATVAITSNSTNTRAASSTTNDSARAYYPNCDAARAAGAAPLYASEPSYRPSLYAHDDGIA